MGGMKAPEQVTEGDRVVGSPQQQDNSEGNIESGQVDLSPIAEPDQEESKLSIELLVKMSNDKLIETLAGWNPLDYDQVREGLAKKLRVRVTTLDQQVKARRKDDPGEISLQIVEEISPYDSAVDGVELADRIYQALKQHIVVNEEDLTVLTLWAIGTYAYDDFMIFPKLLISSPEKRCGKTTLLDVLDALSNRSLVASGITASAMFRTIDVYRPTLLIDEADTFMKNNEELRGIVNSGHRKSTAFIVKSVKVADEYEPRRFSTWSPMVIAGIGGQADTIMDRSVVVNMRRKMAGEEVRRLHRNFKTDHLPTRRMILRWVTDTQLSEVEPPTCSNDRAIDNWTPLFSIAEQLGDVWRERVRSAYSHKTANTEDEASAKTQLLHDIREVFEDTGRPFIESLKLVEALVDMEDSPWCEWKGGRPMTQHSLSRQLKDFKIKSNQKRIGVRNHRVYHLDQFKDAFNRYLISDTPDQSSTQLQVNGGAGFSDYQSATPVHDVALQNQMEANAGVGCSGVSLPTEGHAEPGPCEGVI